MLSARDRLYYCLDVFSMNSDLLEDAERMATATRLESPTFVNGLALIRCAVSHDVESGFVPSGADRCSGC
jgi:hypothetical protein